MTCGEFLKLLQDNPDKKLIFQKVIIPFNENTNSSLVQRIDNLKIRVDQNEVIIECK